MSPCSIVDAGMINVIMNYRHIVAHSNPTDARNRIDKWLRISKLDNIEAAERVREYIWRTSKKCLNEIINNEEKYNDYKKQKNDRIR